MGYMHINNLAGGKEVEPCADGVRPALTLFSGGEPMIRFATLFDKDKLRVLFEELGHPEVTVYGEAYGGRQQGMSHTYGPDLKFIVFDIKIGDSWLTVPKMDAVAQRLGFEVVPWVEVSTDLEALNAERDKPSEVAVRRGMGSDKKREGVVLRPLEEMTTNNDHRVMAKHKIDKFGERATPQTVHNLDQQKLQVLAGANEIANEWVTEERLNHVVAHLTVDGVEPSIESMGKIINAMVEDVEREAKDEIVASKEARQAISRKTATMFKQRLQAALKEQS